MKNTRPRLIGCDFGVPKRAGDQAQKIILIEAIQVGKRRYAITPDGRNERLVRNHTQENSWKARRRGWTLPDLADSLAADRLVRVVAFDFPFSIPLSLLKDEEFARRVNQEPFRTRERWASFVSDNLRLQFDGDNASSTLEDLAKFDAWRDKRFWKTRVTDEATNASSPLKHKFQNVFAMTLAGTALLSRLDATDYHIILDDCDVTLDRCVFETYPRKVANRVGFTGSYKTCSGDCLTKAEEYLKKKDITLDFDCRVRRFCQNYRTSGSDPDGADAFLCLVAAIAFSKGLADLCDGEALPDTLKQEGGIVVPKPI